MGNLLMSAQERDRLVVLRRVKLGELKLRKAAELMDVSYRQAKRLWSRYQAAGDGGVVHGLRGHSSNRGRAAGERERAVALYAEKYGDFGPTLASEYLEQEDGLCVPRETLRRWLKEAGLWSVRRRRAVHRRWRPPKDHAGELVQMDGSHHDWFEGRRGWAVLMVMIDDATKCTYARFFEGETTAAAFEMFQRYVEQRGLPRSLYVDRDSIYRTTRDATVEENLADEPPLTQFGRAMDELGVELIRAHSPQAKGRVERRNGVLQDRLVKALRRRGISDLESANRYLEEEFLPEFNRRFSVSPRQRGDLHRRVPRGVILDRVLSFQEARVVQNDWTVSWRKRFFQLTAANRRLSLVKRRVTVCERLDGTVELLYRGRPLEWVELSEPPQRESKPARAAKGVKRKPYKPAADHPWRRGLNLREKGVSGPHAAGSGVCSAPR